ncbi:sulfate adenylyltransferase subunit CysN [Francisella opportunistica]|uniref:Sulfate adenylyltransferase subunit 1 n=1 Tax=Francisella opportunistica TaxID=2016517 RepID=A0A345JRL5_9GAMM|nr:MULTISPECIES: sulfate adenylyltransferase subunit CysN [Francisella]APC91696.1 Sulfate adenylyltransferase subunit 1 [Francisella sp. MA067296]AXH29961.1 sulfate adenylyltransferase subunit CysN [Francisella opportunistica]AXH31607.1 sulfate adenylyltransferase subunit CysN [Francisella opportunistica]
MSHQSNLIATNIEQYLKQHQQKELLRFITCGSVDDGKSTLIGRLLHDSKMIFEDQLASIVEDSKKVGTQGDKIDLALLVDGLQSEREQGITIDVAYRYFSTDKRKFIIADTPGHEQYTRNMATGASNCDLAIILIDARKGVQTQTRRHSFICSLLGIKHVIVAVNKMDTVGYSQEIYKSIQDDYLKLAGSLQIPDIRFVPISALDGDNVVSKSQKMPWFRGSALIHYLETIKINYAYSDEFRFPVQLVCRPNSVFRGFQGTIVSGNVKVGDTIRVMPSGKITTIKSILSFDGELNEAESGQAITITTHDEIDISRGDMIVHKEAISHVTSKFRANIVWMSEQPLIEYKDYYIKFLTKQVIGAVSKFNYKTDINTLKEIDGGMLELNEIGTVELNLSEPICFDDYQKNRATGAFIIIDRLTNVTAGAGMVIKPLATSNKKDDISKYSEFEVELNALIRKHFPHWGAKNLRE